MAAAGAKNPPRPKWPEFAPLNTLTCCPAEGSPAAELLLGQMKTSATVPSLASQRSKRHFTGIRAYSQELRWLNRGTDAVCLWAALQFSLWGHGSEWDQGHTLIATVAIVVFAFSAEHAGLYESWRSTRLSEEFVAIAIALGCVTIAMLFLGYATKTMQLYPRLAVGTWFLGAAVLVASGRACARLAKERFSPVPYLRTSNIRTRHILQGRRKR